MTFKSKNGLGNWTPERVQALIDMAKLGHTGQEIGIALGVSRSSVCGKAHRLGIRLRGQPFGAINRGGVWRWLDFRKEKPKPVVTITQPFQRKTRTEQRKKLLELTDFAA